MTLKKPPSYLKDGLSNQEESVCRGLEALLLMFGLSVCESVTVLPVRRGWLDGQGLGAFPLWEFHWGDITSEAGAGQMGGWVGGGGRVTHHMASCMCSVQYDMEGKKSTCERL